ncbi:MAG TPA: hypothetical protein VG267_06595 [Terracidiphilus sp.]|nr:hypothetical protein [Terracidiphilus sp.]
MKQEYQLAPGLFVSAKHDTFELEPHWIEWLGTIQANSFRESSLFITAVIQSLGSDTNGLPLPQFLDNRVRLFHHALVLLGCGYNDAVLMVGGEKYHSGGVHIGPIRPGLTPCFHPFYRKRKAIEPIDLEKAARVMSNLELIYSHVPEKLYRRLRKGFNVWVRGVQEGEEWTERIHAFVRAIEAILKCTIARKRSLKTKKSLKRYWRDITPTFIQRGQTIIGSGKSNEAVLRQLYEIRSSIEHIKDILPNVRRVRGVHEREVFGFRALQAEILASAIYERIMASETLLSAFSTEAKVEGFWMRRTDQRQVIWGSPLDIDKSARELFISRIIPDFE